MPGKVGRDDVHGTGLPAKAKELSQSIWLNCMLSCAAALYELDKVCAE